MTKRFIHVAAIILLLTPAGLRAEEDVESLAAKTGLSVSEFKAFAKACESERPKALAALKEMIANAQTREKRDALRAWREDIKDRTKVAYPTLEYPFFENKCGALPGLHFKCVFIVGETVGARLGDQRESLVTLKGIPTKRLALDTWFHHQACFRVTDASGPTLETMETSPVAEYNRSQYGSN